MLKQFRRRKFILRAVIWLLYSTIVTPIIYALVLGFVYHDWRIMTAMLSDPMAPVIQMWNYSSNPVVQRAFATAFMVSLLLSGVFFLIAFRKKKSPLGEASFQTRDDLKAGGWFKKDGHILGKFREDILRVKDDWHHLVIAPSRAGKGVGYVIPNALMHQGSLVVLDLKGEVWNATAGYRAKNGNRVFRFNPCAEETFHFNPLHSVSHEVGKRTTDIQNIAIQLIPSKNGDNAVWQEMAQQVLGGLISYVLESEYYNHRRNLSEVNKILNCGVNLQELMKEILIKEPELCRFTRESFNFFIALSEKTAASALTDVQNAMKPWKNERIAAATEYTDIDLDLNFKDVSIYLTPDVNELALLAPLMSLFVQQLTARLTKEKDANKVHVLFILDEFAQMGKMNEIMLKLPFLAGFKVKFAFILQDLKSMDNIYGESVRHSMMNNCGYQLILGANDLPTTEYVSRALGKYTVTYTSQSHSSAWFGQSKGTVSETIRERDLMMPQEVRQMPADRFVMLVGGQKPIFGHKLKFFETEPFKSASAFAENHRPPVPRLEYRAYLPVPAVTDNYGVDEKITPAAPAKPQLKAQVPAVPEAPKRLESSESNVVEPVVEDTATDQENATDLESAAAAAMARMEARAAAVEEAVSNAANRVPKRVRRPVNEIYFATVPDPEPDGKKTAA